METDMENPLETTHLAEGAERERKRLKETTQAIAHRAKAAAQYTDDYVHTSPWVAVGAAVAAGVLLGLLFGRTR